MGKIHVKAEKTKTWKVEKFFQLELLNLTLTSYDAETWSLFQFLSSFSSCDH